MNYARQGLSVHFRQFLGRRKSSAAFRYIEEAMTEIPMNLGVAREEPEQDKVAKERAKRRALKPKAAAAPPHRDAALPACK